MSHPIRYRRGDGKLLYQPVAGEARQVWRSSYATDGYEKTWSDSWEADGNATRPVTYKSKARAERIGRREEKRRAKAELMRIEEL